MAVLSLRLKLGVEVGDHYNELQKIVFFTMQ